MSISSTVLEGAEIQFFPATALLRPYVGCFWVITARSDAVMRLVPDGTTSIAFERQSDESCSGYLRGPLLRSVERRFSAPTLLIGVRLRPGVAFNLTASPIDRIVDRRVPLQEVEELRALAAIEKMNQSPAQLISTLQGALCQQLATTSLHPIVERALAAIHAECGDISVSDVAVRCNTSARHLGRLLREWVGFGPKRYAAIVRFQSSLAGMAQAPQLSVASLASETGYFDQSHLSAEVTRFAGDTPGRLIEEHVSEFSKTQCDVPF
jgi:AraC-like DNA-binding protein